MGTKQELTLRELDEKKAKRIIDHRDRAAIVGTERAWKRFALGEITEREFFDLKPVKDLMNKKLDGLAKDLKNRRLCREDFEEVLFEEAVNVLYNYSWTLEYSCMRPFRSLSKIEPST